MGWRVIIRLKQAFSAEATRERKERMAEVLLKQIKTRIMEGGDEDGKFAPLDFPRPNGSQDNPLWSTGRHLLNSLTKGVTATGFWVGTNFIGARIHQLGTVGKGGLLPSIKPINAKALFIPTSGAGAKSILRGGKRVAIVKRKGKEVIKDLKQGSGKLTKDFLFVQKVDINPRPYLRLTEGNKRELAEAFAGGNP